MSTTVDTAKTRAEAEQETARARVAGSLEGIAEISAQAATSHDGLDNYGASRAIS